MKIDLTDITSPIHDVLKPLGFAKRAKRKWYRVTSEVCQELRLIKSSWSQKNWLEARFSVRRFCLDSDLDYGSMFYFVESIPENEKLDLEYALDMDFVNMTPNKRAETIKIALKKYAVPILIKAETEGGLRDAYLEAKNLMVFRMHKKTQQDFGIWRDP